MDTGTKVTKNRNPAENANPLSLLTFVYMFPIFRKTFKESLTEDDLFSPLTEHKSSILGSKLERIWKEEYRIHKKTALHRALFRVFGLWYSILGILKLVDELLLLIGMPLCIGKLVSFFETGPTSTSQDEAFIYAGILVLCLIVNTFLANPTFMGLQHISMKLRVSCSSLVYRKVLKFSKTALGNTTVGQLVTLLSNDVSKFDQMFVLAHYAWIGPIQVALGTWLLYRQIGIGSLFGVGFLVSFVPLQIYLANKTSVLRLRTALRTDERVRLMNEIISGIQVIKMYCWENSFAKLISFARGKEMKAIRAHSFLTGIIYSFEIFITRTSIFISILAYVLLGNYITADKIFAITAIYNCLRPVITILFSLSVSSLAEIHVTILRIQKILAFEEKEKSVDHFDKLNGNDSMPLIIKNGTNKDTKELPQRNPKAKILLEKVSAKWVEDAAEDTLSNISVCVSSNKILALIGPVGSGKSSVINLLLRELPVKSGKMELVGRVSYASQEPWLFAASVRQNILFGAEYNEELYQKVVDVCALRSDFALFPYGDKTLVGEKGKALSGGQKARINLARCIYKSADIYLLDDPLSAVDANVGKHLYERCIKDFLSNKICVLATHQLQYLKNVDNIIIMNDGEIEMEGTYEDLQKSGLDFAKMMEDFHSEEVVEKQKKKIQSRQNTIVEESESEDDEDQIMEKEFQGSGSIKAETYWNYFRAGGGKVSITVLIFLFIFCQVFANGGEYYVSYWVNQEQEFTNRITNNQTNETFERNTIIYYYSALTIGTIIIGLVKSIYFMMFFAVASGNLHDFIFSRIIRATMRFYNTNPSGRILNRFSKDLGTIDEYIPSIIIDVTEIFLLLIGVIVLSSIVEPWLIVPSVVLIVIFYFVRVIYIKTSRCVKRIEAITKSPMLSHLTATVNGLSTVRAFSAEEMLIKEFDEYQDVHSAAWFLYMASSKCFGFWLDIICIVFIAVAVFLLLVFSKEMQGGDLGLVVTQYIGLIGTLQWGMRQWTELENNMTSVERILEYTKLESEPDRKQEKPLAANWGEKGQIEFRDVKLRYSDSEPYVLKDMNFLVQPREKIGIVGRTGAGKSSTITALFQLYPLEGTVIIDGEDTTKMPLDTVRSKISIIPQEPVLFSGSMRKNLDPFDQYDDEVLWNALDQVELKEVIEDLPAGLNTAVSEGGANFSVGQRQLVCLARALIRNNKILVLDEATANVDPHTDALVQTTIREKFADCSVLTIAHRLHTVMDSDKILVMDAGTVEEFDHPHNLLQKENGILRSLVEVTGSITSKHLASIAEENYLKKKNI
ncbi:unnamed protein product [Phaedon cochleariae]|uniref:Multidrug resistance-associated protein lethal(2)03659 n=1 Tax=Phaedon cochleariae TaxID=80249 RepID=A0A9N9S7S3_PHACE|nr:unnamed protein product [Phaedon cochleariae]